MGAYLYLTDLNKEQREEWLRVLRRRRKDLEEVLANPNNWSQISTLEYRNSGSWELDPFTMDIIRDGSDLRVFWDQEVKYLLHEIYSVNYNVETGKWGPVIQITDTNTINDDYEEAPGFTLTTTLIFLLITFFFRKKKNNSGFKDGLTKVLQFYNLGAICE